MKLRLISLLIVLTTLLIPLSAHSRELSPRTIPREYHAARDRIKIGDVNEAILILQDYLRNNPNHEPSVKLFFRYLDHRTSDTIYKRAMKIHFSRTRQTWLFLEVLNGSSLANNHQYDLLRWANDELPSTADLYDQSLRMAKRAGDTEFIQTHAREFVTEFNRAPGIVEFYADWYARHDNWTRAASLYQRLKSIRPGYHRGYEGLARYNRQQGNTDKAQRLESRASALRTNDD